MNEQSSTQREYSRAEIKAEINNYDTSPADRRMLRTLLYGKPELRAKNIIHNVALSGTRQTHQSKPKNMTGRQFKRYRKQFKRAVRLVNQHPELIKEEVVE